MKIVTLTLANDEICICSRCQKDGRSRSYTHMINAIRETWAAEEVEGVKNFFIYGHRKGIDFPENSKIINSKERYWPNGGAGDGVLPVDVETKRKAFAIDDCIYSDTPEGRENLYYKTVDGFEWLVENEDFDYLIRPSAGSYIDLLLFKKFLEGIGIRDNVYAGSIGTYNNKHNATQPPSIKFASGAGFIASRNLIESLVMRRNIIDPVRSPYASATISDDVTFAKHFSYDLGVPIIQFPKHQFTSVAQVDERVKDHMHCYFTHTINPDLMYAVHAAKGLTRKVIY